MEFSRVKVFSGCCWTFKESFASSLGSQFFLAGCPLLLEDSPASSLSFSLLDEFLSLSVRVVPYNLAPLLEPLSLVQRQPLQFFCLRDSSPSSGID